MIRYSWYWGDGETMRWPPESVAWITIGPVDDDGMVMEDLCVIMVESNCDTDEDGFTMISAEQLRHAERKAGAIVNALNTAEMMREAASNEAVLVTEIKRSQRFDDDPDSINYDPRCTCGHDDCGAC